MTRLILGSKSPRRHEILSYFSIPFEQISPAFCEEDIPENPDPKVYAFDIALGKANDLSHQYPDASILTADTVVFKGGKFYGKPSDRREAHRSLQELAGGWHSVYTALVLAHQGKIHSGIEETKVLFNPLTSLQIERYLDALHWADKAGGYAIQLAGSLIVRRIEGCYYNVMGLPIHQMAALFKLIGIDLWEHLK